MHNTHYNTHLVGWRGGQAGLGFSRPPREGLSTSLLPLPWGEAVCVEGPRPLPHTTSPPQPTCTHTHSHLHGRTALASPPPTCGVINQPPATPPPFPTHRLSSPNHHAHTAVLAFYPVFQHTTHYNTHLVGWRGGQAGLGSNLPPDLRRFIYKPPATPMGRRGVCGGAPSTPTHHLSYSTHVRPHAYTPACSPVHHTPHHYSCMHPVQQWLHSAACPTSQVNLVLCCVRPAGGDCSPQQKVLLQQVLVMLQ
jgi:hypothetical protein